MTPPGELAPRVEALWAMLDRLSALDLTLGEAKELRARVLDALANPSAGVHPAPAPHCPEAAGYGH